VLLFVFAMAAIIAVTLYMQVPRVAFEAQRDREQLLMSRGHEYIRAITLFVHKFNRFPASMDELENTNNLRFLRRRYVDPMTGKADWRLLHAGPGGAITDSILSTKKPDATADPVNIAMLQMFGTQTVGDSEGVNLAARKRASDQPGGPGDLPMGGGNGSVDNNTLSASGNSPAAGNSGYNGPVMVLPNGTIVPATSGQSGTAPASGAQTGNSPLLGAPGSPGTANGQLPSGVAIQQNTQNGQNTPGLPGQLQPPNSAANLINQILTTPRPGGLNGMQGVGGPLGTTSQAGTSLTTTPATNSSTTAPGQQVVGAGLAGVASKREQEGIKTYNDRKKYNEWEFVYDVTKDPTKVGSAAAAANAAAGASGGQGRSGQSTSGQTNSGQTTATPSMTGSATPSQ
jgi:hypothetical protein